MTLRPRWPSVSRPMGRPPRGRGFDGVATEHGARGWGGGGGGACRGWTGWWARGWVWSVLTPGGGGAGGGGGGGWGGWGGARGGAARRVGGHRGHGGRVAGRDAWDRSGVFVFFL